MAYLETWNIQKLGGILISVRHIVVSWQIKSVREVVLKILLVRVSSIWFGTKNYVWRLGITQKSFWICWFFGPKMPRYLQTKICNTLRPKYVDSSWKECIEWVYPNILAQKSGHKWSTTHRVFKSHRSTMSIFICYHQNNVPSRLSPQWPCAGREGTLFS